jgi:hypothetical protein
MELTVPGKIPFNVRPLRSSDLEELQTFCDECGNLGYNNNKDFSSMKLEQMKMPYGQFFVAETADGKIFSVAGVHRLPEVHPKAWRCLFRGAQLPGYTPSFSLDIFKSGIHFSQFLYLQIKFVQSLETDSEFYITTNIDNPNAGASSRMDKVMMPRIAERGYWTLEDNNFLLFNTMQSLWKVNVEKYMTDRLSYFGS